MLVIFNALVHCVSGNETVMCVSSCHLSLLYPYQYYAAPPSPPRGLDIFEATILPHPGRYECLTILAYYLGIG